MSWVEWFLFLTHIIADMVQNIEVPQWHYIFLVLFLYLETFIVYWTDIVNTWIVNSVSLFQQTSRIPSYSDIYSNCVVAYRTYCNTFWIQNGWKWMSFYITITIYNNQTCNEQGRLQHFGGPGHLQEMKPMTIHVGVIV